MHAHMCESIYACRSACMFPCAHVCIHAGIYVCMHVCMYGCMCECRCIYVVLRACLHLCICILACTHVMHISMYACMCVRRICTLNFIFVRMYDGTRPQHYFRVVGFVQGCCYDFVAGAGMSCPHLKSQVFLYLELLDLMGVMQRC